MIKPFQYFRNEGEDPCNFSEQKFESLLDCGSYALTVTEPFEDKLVLCVVEKIGTMEDELGQCVIPLHDVEKRLDFNPPGSKWYNLEKHDVGKKGKRNVIRLNSWLHLRICFDWGYHVLGELTHYSSDLRASARQLWKPAVGVLELGILNAQNLAAMKSRDGKRCTDAYCVVKYGQKWIRTRTILNSFNPKWKA